MINRRHSLADTTFLQKIVADFLAGLGNEAEITIMCEGQEFTFNNSRLDPSGDGVLPEYALAQDNWNAFCDASFWNMVM